MCVISTICMPYMSQLAGLKILKQETNSNYKQNDFVVNSWNDCKVLSPAWGSHSQGPLVKGIISIQVVVDKSTHPSDDN